MTSNGERLATSAFILFSGGTLMLCNPLLMVLYKHPYRSAYKTFYGMIDAWCLLATSLGYPFFSCSLRVSVWKD